MTRDEQTCLTCELPDTACDGDPRCPFVQIRRVEPEKKHVSPRAAYWRARYEKQKAPTAAATSGGFYGNRREIMAMVKEGRAAKG